MSDLTDVQMRSDFERTGELAPMYARELFSRLSSHRAELDRLDSWDGLMELLDRRWPEDIFPTLPDDENRDPGPRIVSLLRWVASLRAELGALKDERRVEHHGADEDIDVLYERDDFGPSEVRFYLSGAKNDREAMVRFLLALSPNPEGETT